MCVFLKAPSLEDFSHLPPEQRRKRLQQRIDELHKELQKEMDQRSVSICNQPSLVLWLMMGGEGLLVHLHKTTIFISPVSFVRDALNKMKDVYEKNPQMGDPSSLQPKISETICNMEKLRSEIHKNEVWREPERRRRCGRLTLTLRCAGQQTWLAEVEGKQSSRDRRHSADNHHRAPQGRERYGRGGRVGRATARTRNTLTILFGPLSAAAVLRAVTQTTPVRSTTRRIATPNLRSQETPTPTRTSSTTSSTTTTRCPSSDTAKLSMASTVGANWCFWCKRNPNASVLTWSPRRLCLPPRSERGDAFDGGRRGNWLPILIRLLTDVVLLNKIN